MNIVELSNKLQILDLTEKDRIAALKVIEASGLLTAEWENVVDHCFAVGQVIDYLIKQINMVDASEVITAGLIHDSKKHVEKKLATELTSTGMSKGEAFTQAALQQSEWLVEMGIDPETVSLSGLSGHTSLAHFAVGSSTIRERIFHLADDLCGGERGDEVVMIADRIEALKVRYPWLCDEGEDALRGETFIEAQERIALEILDEIASLMGIDSGLLLNKQLVEKFAV